MRFLIEIELTTVVPLVVEAECQEEALQALREATDDTLPSGDPIPLPPTIKSVTELGE